MRQNNGQPNRWPKLPMMDIFRLSVPGPSGHENDTFVSDTGIYKVNNLLNNNGSIVSLLHRVLLHNIIFPETAYSFDGFAGFDGRTVHPILFSAEGRQRPASQADND